MKSLLKWKGLAHKASSYTTLLGSILEALTAPAEEIDGGFLSKNYPKRFDQISLGYSPVSYNTPDAFYGCPLSITFPGKEGPIQLHSHHC